MIMSIKLEYILRRNKTNLKVFIDKNKLTSYERLIEYCEYRGFIPCDLQEYNKAANHKDDKLEETKDERKVRRQTSKTQKTKKTRNSRKKQPSAPKLSDSTDKR